MTTSTDSAKPAGDRSPHDIDTIMRKIADFGNDCSVVKQIPFTFDLLLPAQAAHHAASPYSEPDHEFSYGSHPRQKLDIYLPSGMKAGDKKPVLLFVYGGGFMVGDKRSSPGEYMALGNYFARAGYVTIILDYRRVPDGAKYPSGAEDLSLALQWLARGDVPAADLQNVFYLGASAGGMHLATLLWGTFPDSSVVHPSAIPQIKLRGVLFLSIRYSSPNAEAVGPTDAAYYGSAQAALASYPGVLRAQSHDKTPVLAFYGTYDPKEQFLEPLALFRERYAEKQADHGPLDVYECRGHNHISLPLTLNLGRGSDEWAQYAVSWMSKLSKA